MNEDQIDHLVMGMVRVLLRTAKWFLFQYLLLFFFPFVWGNHIGTGVSLFMALYTLIYAVYEEIQEPKSRFRNLPVPYLIYVCICLLFFLFGNASFSFIGLVLGLPFGGLACLISVRFLQKKIFRKRMTLLRKIFCGVLSFLVLFALESFRVSWNCKNQGTFESERAELLARKDFLVSQLMTTPQGVLHQMPSLIGSQFQGEWALYSCSMLSAALTNLSFIYPDTKEENAAQLDRLIQLVLSPELRQYDTDRWKEDALETLEGPASHLSYLSHLAWMMGSYELISKDNKYASLHADICEALYRRMRRSKSLNLPTYPDESIYVPDMLVALVALQQYGTLHRGAYQSMVKAWVKRAQKDWCDSSTGLLVSFLDETGTQIEGAPVKGSYSALNCSYLTLIDPTFAREQYDCLKKYFWKDGLISGFKEYHNHPCPIGFDMDAGPVLFDLSPSGTAFAIGAATFLNDSVVRSQILRTAEKAGRTVSFQGQKHYALANVALVGEAIMLAMRTNILMDDR